MFGLADKIIAYICMGIAVAAITAALICGWMLRSARADLSTKVQENATLTADLGTQTRAVERLKASTDKARQNAAQALAEAKAMAVVQQGSIDALQGRILTSPHTSCSAAVLEIRESLK